MATFRNIPGVDSLARSARLAEFPSQVRLAASRHATGVARTLGESAKKMLSEEEILEHAIMFAKKMSQPSLRPAINASGVILHTGLGRARLADEVAAHIFAVAQQHAVTEFDLETGERGDRQAHVRDLLRDLTGAEDAIVVNNCAAGLFLTLTALCSGSEVILSRGQMVEIGGAFRMPDIIRQSGCRLVEVGCTNRTRQSDYEEAITEETAAIVRCHPSNFKVIGFQSEVPASALAGLCRERGLVLIDDVGHGCIADTTKFGLPAHPTLRDAIVDGADIVLASGDKLLGGPQAGIILGKSELIKSIRTHALARAVRVDKLTLAGLEVTLRMYAEGRAADLPLWEAMGKPLPAIKRAAQSLGRAYAGSSVVAAGETEMGGGSMPGVTIPTWRVGLASNSADRLARRLRAANPPLVGRIEHGRVWLDPRTMTAAEVKIAQTILREVSNDES